MLVKVAVAEQVELVNIGGTTCNAATAGGRGSYNPGDTSVYGPGDTPA